MKRCFCFSTSSLSSIKWQLTFQSKTEKTESLAPGKVRVSLQVQVEATTGAPNKPNIEPNHRQYKPPGKVRGSLHTSSIQSWDDATTSFLQRFSLCKFSFLHGYIFSSLFLPFTAQFSRPSKLVSKEKLSGQICETNILCNHTPVSCFKCTSWHCGDVLVQNTCWICYNK